ncbi:MAG: hypothetical protein A3K76_02250 [Euryarchaeota archaeon RBG_13_57_23]|nr:MAG: hypothetical protein A3K76_02250 [Euryarchaeota archaeon RBG_13_57_23]
MGLAAVLVFLAMSVVCAQPALAKPGGTGKPNIVAAEIWTDPVQPVGYASATIWYGIATNTKVPITTGFYTDLFIDNTFVQRSYTASMGGGMWQEFSYECTLSSGPHTLKMVTDATKVISEVLETDNTLSTTISWQSPGPPDLVSVDIWTKPLHPIAGLPVTIFFSIANIGEEPAFYQNGILMGLWVGASLLYGTDIQTVPQHSEVTFSCTTTFGVIPATYTLTSRADARNRVAESDESNNDRIEERYWAENTYDTDGDGLVDGVEWHLGTDTNGYKKWAVLVEGGWIAGDSKIQAAFRNSICDVYSKLLSAGYTTSSIYLISKGSYDLDGDGASDVDADATYDNLMNAIYSVNGWLRSRCDADDRVLVYMIDHGRDPDGHFLVNGVSQDPSFDEYVTDEELATWLGAVTCHRQIVVVDACFSGNFHDDLYDLHDQERMTITATDSIHPGWADDPDNAVGSGDEFVVFTEGFLATLTGASMESAFAHADNFVFDWCLVKGLQYPFPQLQDYDTATNWYL